MTRPSTIQARNRSQVSTLRLSMRYRQANAERIGTAGDHGTRNLRSRSGLVRRSTGTAIETRTNANSVPMLTRVASVSSLTNAAITRTTAAYSRVMRTGVPVRGETFAIAGGSSPARPIAKPIRLTVTRSTRITEVSPATAASDTRAEAQPRPFWSKAFAMGAPSSILVYLTIPTTTNETPT